MYTIGSKIITKYGNTLEVLDEYKKWSCNRNRSYCTVSCSICSEDSELFPTPFEIRRDGLMSGQTPCCCAKNGYSWTERQQALRISRILTDNNKEFRGFCGDFIGDRTKVRLYCNTHDYVSETSSVGFIIGSGDGGCHRCKGEKIQRAFLQEDKVLTANFMRTGSFPVGTLFEREYKEEFYNNSWIVTCPVCAEDEYSISGIGLNSFKSSTGKLNKGGRPCRCGRGYPWTQQEREYQISKRLSGIYPDGVFLGWDEGYYKDSHSHFSYHCGDDLHKLRSVTVNAFLTGKADCIECNKYLSTNNWGLYTEREDEVDYLYVLIMSTSNVEFLKVGRSFNLEQRFQFYRQDGFDYKLVCSVKGLHKDIYKLESEVLRAFRASKYTHGEAFGGWTECLTINSLNDVVDYLKVKDLNLTLYKE